MGATRTLSCCGQCQTVGLTRLCKISTRDIAMQCELCESLGVPGHDYVAVYDECNQPHTVYLYISYVLD